ncbi:DUF4384 domain-containing protein [Acidovorax sp. CCYZU-2555]|uniref:DUF4384 domain-containing protein n=1 Tax=Acidovorax sp. CCYZU-2555 TaxID=2835042 RepID=UPI001BD17E2A|nr:DUF4384 domain-containing protein [Acidovorax sp. CCYZU-2555]MBS7777918.1 DUF4384 domain-containing protein [Acidovorax sp. CCYZU-2555]
MMLASGCGQLDARRDIGVHSQATVLNRPVVRPVRSISSFSESLNCMDHMLRAAELPTTLISSKQFPDFSGKVPVAVKDMVVTSLSQMSHLSNAFRYVDYEVDIARQDTVQNLTTILLNNNQMQLQRPALYVSGAIAFVDQNVTSQRKSAGVSSDRVDAGYSASNSATVVALEVHLGDFRTRTIIPGLDSANEVVIGGAGQGLDLAGRIGTYGVRFNVGRDYAMGTGGALRTLVDLAMIELVGKWARVPYWQCLMLNQTNPNFQRQMRDWYNESGTSGQLRLVRSSLISRGYLSSDQSDLGANHPVMRQATARFQADTGLIVTGIIDFSTYEFALRNFVALDDNGALTRIGWDNSGPSTSRVTVPATAAVAPWFINMQLENPQPAGLRPAFSEGDQIFLSATVSRASHLYCYYVDAAGTATRLLPNALQTNTLVAADQAIRIPDWMGANPGFILDAGKPGTESALCIATNEDAMPKLPPELQGPALTAVKDLQGAPGLRQRFLDAMGPQGSVAQVIRWNVVGRKAAGPAENEAK